MKKILITFTVSFIIAINSFAKIEGIEGFDIFAPRPIDSRMVFDDTNAMYNLNSNFRYEGLLAFVKEDNIFYHLVDGTANSNWLPLASQSAITNDINDIYVNVDGDTMSGELNMGDNQVSDLADGVDAQDAVNLSQLVAATNGIENLSQTDITNMIDDVYVNDDGDTMTGFLYLNADPTSNLHAVTKQYVDASYRWKDTPNIYDYGVGYGEGTIAITPLNPNVKVLQISNDANTYTTLRLMNYNSSGNYSGSLIELKGPGANHHNHLTIAKYNANFWQPSLRTKGAVLNNDYSLMLGTLNSNKLIEFVVGNKTDYSSIRTVMSLSKDTLLTSNNIVSTMLKNTSDHPSNYKSVFVDTDSGKLYSQEITGETQITNLINDIYVNVDGDTMSGNLNMDGNNISDINVINSINDITAIGAVGDIGSIDSLGYIDSSFSLQGNVITVLGDGVNATDSINLGQLVSATNNILLDNYIKKDSGIGWDTTITNLTTVEPINDFDNSNFKVGFNAATNATGVNNIYLGKESGNSSSGTNNCYFGNNAGINAVGNLNYYAGEKAGDGANGNDNLYIGKDSGRWATGNNNDYIGRSAGHNASGDYNLFVGDGSGYDSAGSYNSCLGYGAGNRNEAQFSLFLGEGTGYHAVGRRGTYIGYFAGAHSHSTNCLFLGTYAGKYKHDALNTVFLGDYIAVNCNTARIVNVTAAVDDNDVVIFSQLIDATNNINIDAYTTFEEATNIVDAFNDDIAEANGVGWDTTITNLTTVEPINDFDNSNFKVGFNAATNAVGVNNIYLGKESGNSSSGTNNNYFGNNAGINAVGNLNYYVGEKAGDGASGNDNLYIGKNSGRWATGNNNDHIGRSAGNKANGDYNLFVGEASGYDSEGSYNSCLGYGAGNRNKASHSLFLGQGAGYRAFGYRGIYIGYFTGADSYSTNCLFLGPYAGDYKRDALNTVFLGDYTAVNCNTARIVNVTAAVDDNDVVILSQLIAATNNFSSEPVTGNYVLKTGDTMSGSLTVTGTVKGLSSSIHAGYFDADYTSVYVYADQNYGIYSYAHNSYGVYGDAKASYGVYGAAESYGVYGKADSSYGVYGEAMEYGVYGQAAFRGIYGEASEEWSIYAAEATEDPEKTFYCGGGSEFHGDIRLEGDMKIASGRLVVTNGSTSIASASYKAGSFASDDRGISVRGDTYAINAYATSHYGIYSEAAYDYGVRGFAGRNYGVHGQSDGNYGVYGIASDDWSMYAATAGNEENTFYCGGGSEFHGDMRIIGPTTTSDAKLNIDSGGTDRNALIDFIDDDGARARIGFDGGEGAGVFNCIDPISINSGSIDSSSVEIEIQNDSVEIAANVDINGDVDVEGSVSRGGFFMAYTLTGNQSFNGASEDIDFVNEKCEDNQYKHSTSTNPDEITLMETGWYKVSYNINFENDGTDRTDIRVGCVWNSTYQAGSYSFTYLRSGTFGDNGTCSATILINVTIAERVLRLISTGKYAGGSWGSGCNYHVTRDSCIVIEKVK